jgi:glycosyltransferase involved in cell wall biosynthesis
MTATDGDEVLFVGHLGYRPNCRAVAELATLIFPQVNAQHPNVSLHICGRRPKRSLTVRLARMGVRLTASPKDLAPIYARATLTAMPIREGGGTRIKVVEALACGCPVVATAKAVEGHGLRDDHEFILAETAAEFQSAISRLLGDKDLRQRLRAAGHRFLAANLAPDVRERAVRTALTQAGLQAFHDDAIA